MSSTSKTSSISKAIEIKCKVDKREEEMWDEKLENTVNDVEAWRTEKIGIGPEPKLVPSAVEGIAEATIYADNNSAGEVAESVPELKTKTEVMLGKIFENMRASRLLINSGKTKVMLFATTQKRAKNNLKFHLDIEGKQIEEVETATLLGVTLANNFSWNQQTDEVIAKCSNRLSGLYKVQHQLDRAQKKNLVEGAIVSRLRYALEVISSGSEKNIRRYEGMQSKSARYVLGVSRKDWSRTAGYRELNWLTIPQTAVEMSLRMFFKVLFNRKPEKIFRSLVDEDSEELYFISDDDLSRMTKLCKRSWRTRVLRYAAVIPP